MNSTTDDTDTKRRRQDFEDLQNEISGNETGRRARFMPAKDHSPEGRRRKKERERFTELMRLLLDPTYAALYHKVLDRLRDAESATEAAIAQVEGEIAAAEAELADIESSAARLPDGTRVYRDADGTIRREDGSIVEGSEAESIVWRGDEPSYEEMQAARQRLAELRRILQELFDYQNGVLGPARDRLEDHDNPPSADELRDVLRDLEERMPNRIADEPQSTEAPASAAEASTSIRIPDLGGR